MLVLMLMLMLMGMKLNMNMMMMIQVAFSPYLPILVSKIKCGGNNTGAKSA